MKFSWHAVGQALLTGGQILNWASGVVPPKYQPYVMCGLTVTQALLGLYNHYFTPAGERIKT